ncbi:unnamed protein product [Adineta steineri]|uniref:Proteasome activator complex subunit 4 C-terminal domain-containing protein n=1 Tax=Adineta steineri TaxID=433720 RepID=A0A815TR54_9BILA|nr:unnamed protein product [Adineta steineri]
MDCMVVDQGSVEQKFQCYLNSGQKLHFGILGLCAIVLTSPYDIPGHVPKVLMQLCAHSHDPDLIQKSIKQCVSDFRRTHHDSWHYEHRQHFADD